MRKRAPIIPDISKRKFSQQVESLSQSERAVLSIVGELPFSEETDQSPEEFEEEAEKNEALVDVQTPNSTSRPATPDSQINQTPKSTRLPDMPDAQTSSSIKRPTQSDTQASSSTVRPDHPDVQSSSPAGLQGDNRTSERPDSQTPRRPDFSIPIQQEKTPVTSEPTLPEDPLSQRKKTKKLALRDTGQKITLYLEPDVVMKAKILATMEKSTMSELIGKVLKEHFSSE